MAQISASHPKGALPLLSVRDLSIEINTRSGVIRPVRGVSFDLHQEEVLAIVGESGSGKSVAVMGLLGLLPKGVAKVTGGRAMFGDIDLLSISQAELREIRGKNISMVFQDPLTALNPVFRVGEQIMEAIRVHDDKISEAALRKRAVELLDLVRIPDAPSRVDQYPHEFSGGMRQRVMIAIAAANRPEIIIADEPTTALDVTIQAQILELLDDLRRETGTAIVLITHDLGVVAEVADRVMTMYAGKAVETASVFDLFARPMHPYTAGLLSCIPRISDRRSRLLTIAGGPPDVTRLPGGCPFLPRCSLAKGRAECQDVEPTLLPVEPNHLSACHFSGELRKVENVGKKV